MTVLPPDGVSVALVSPVTPDGELDGPAIDRLVAAVLDGGATGLSPGGSTGEGVRLSGAQRRELVSRVAAGARGRPVIAGVPPFPRTDLLAEIAAVADAGADAVLLTPPGPYAISGDELAEHFEGLADASAVPIMLYHIPRLAGIGFAPEVVARMARHARITGLKDSGRDMEYLYAATGASRDEEFRIVTGTDILLPESLTAGAVGAIVASPNVAPSWTVQLYDAAMAGDSGTVAKVRAQLIELVGVCRGVGFPDGWKAGAALLGLCGPHPLPPGHGASAAATEQLAATFADLGLLAR